MNETWLNKKRLTSVHKLVLSTPLILDMSGGLDGFPKSQCHHHGQRM